MKTTALIASLSLLGLVGCTDYDQPADRTSEVSPPAQTAPDDTARTAPSTPSTTGGTPTTGSPSMTEADRALAQSVQQALSQDPSLAPAAQNIQVRANNGEVTLQGSVSSEQEKADIGAKAQQVAGVTRVNNQLEVTSASG